MRLVFLLFSSAYCCCCQNIFLHLGKNIWPNCQTHRSKISSDKIFLWQAQREKKRERTISWSSILVQTSLHGSQTQYHHHLRAFSYQINIKRRLWLSVFCVFFFLSSQAQYLNSARSRKDDDKNKMNILIVVPQPEWCAV